MESNETFGQEITEDPFAGSDFGDWEQETPDSSPPVEAPPDAAPPMAQASAPPPAATAPPAPTTPASASEPQPEGSDRPEIPSEPASQAPQEPPHAPAGVGAPPNGQTAPQSAAEAAGEEAGRREVEGDVPIDTEGLPDPAWDAEQMVADPEENGRDETRVLTEDDLAEAGYDGPVAEEGEVPVTHPAHPVNQPTEVGVEEAPEPEDQKDKRGRVTHRRYVILRAEGKGRFSQLHWYVNAKGSLVPNNSSGAKRQTVTLARGTEDALKFGYLVSGGPQDGIDLVAVAAAYFQVKHVAPLPPEPAKQRLQIN